MNAKPRAHTADELRNRLYLHMFFMCKYWSQQRGRGNETEIDRMEGLCHSILTYIDGNSGAAPCGMDLVLRPHESDKAYCIKNGENWAEDGMVINGDCLLHEMFFTVKPKS